MNPVKPAGGICAFQELGKNLPHHGPQRAKLALMAFPIEAHEGLPPVLGQLDPYGWIIADFLKDQMERYGVKTASIRHLVLPRHFTPQEIHDNSYPIRHLNKDIATKTGHWLAAGGGKNGRPRGIAVNELSLSRPPHLSEPGGTAGITGTRTNGPGFRATQGVGGDSQRICRQAGVWHPPGRGVPPFPLPG